jgi:hypothetical protein
LAGIAGPLAPSGIVVAVVFAVAFFPVESEATVAKCEEAISDEATAAILLSPASADASAAGRDGDTLLLNVEEVKVGGRRSNGIAVIRTTERQTPWTQQIWIRVFPKVFRFLPCQISWMHTSLIKYSQFSHRSTRKCLLS